jgi:hypothetical protein
MTASIYILAITVLTVSARGFLRTTQKLRYDAYIRHASRITAVQPKTVVPLIVGNNKMDEYSWVEVGNYIKNTGDKNYYRGINMMTVCEFNDMVKDVQQKFPKSIQLFILKSRIQKLNKGLIVSKGLFYSPRKLMTIVVNILEKRLRCG